MEVVVRLVSTKTFRVGWTSTGVGIHVTPDLSFVPLAFRSRVFRSASMTDEVNSSSKMTLPRVARASMAVHSGTTSQFPLLLLFQFAVAAGVVGTMPVPVSSS